MRFTETCSIHHHIWTRILAEQRDLSAINSGTNRTRETISHIAADQRTIGGFGHTRRHGLQSGYSGNRTENGFEAAQSQWQIGMPTRKLPRRASDEYRRIAQGVHRSVSDGKL